MNLRFITQLALPALVLLPVPAITADWIYRFEKGDTLWDICLAYTSRQGCWKELSTYNGFSNDRAIRAGTEIRIPHSWLLRVPEVALAKVVQGSVSYDARDSGERVALQQGQSLLLGSRVITGEGSARLEFGDFSEVLIRPHSEMKLNRLSSEKGRGAAELLLDNGEVEAEVDPYSSPRFEIRTPSAIAAVRGTSYRVNSGSTSGVEATRSEVLTGAVAVQAEDKIEVPAGYGVIAREGQAVSEPRKLISAPTFSSNRLDGPLPMKVAWENDPLAVAWQIDAFTPDVSGALVKSWGTTTAQLAISDLDLGCYQLAVRGIDVDGFNGLQGVLPVCVETAPAPVEVEEEPSWLWAVGIYLGALLIFAL